MKRARSDARDIDKQIEKTKETLEQLYEKKRDIVAAECKNIVPDNLISFETFGNWFKKHFRSFQYRPQTDLYSRDTFGELVVHFTHGALRLPFSGSGEFTSADTNESTFRHDAAFAQVVTQVPEEWKPVYRMFFITMIEQALMYTFDNVPEETLWTKRDRDNMKAIIKDHKKKCYL